MKIISITKLPKIHMFIKLSFVVVLLLVSINLFAPKSAQAIPPDNPLLSFVMPTDRYNYLVDEYLAPSPCTAADHQDRSPAVTRWVSLANDPTSRSITVDYGTPSINLRYWTAGVICYNSKAMRVSDVLTNISLDPWGASNFTPTTLNIDYDWSNPGSYSSTSTSAFTYAPTGGFTQSDTYRVHVYGRVGLRWTQSDGSYSYVCVATGAASNAFYSNCPTEDMLFSILVTVRPEPSIWNYIHNSFTTSPNSATSTTPSTSFRYRPGSNITVNNQIRNNGGGAGRDYTHQVNVSQNGGATWPSGINPIMDRSETGIGGGSNKTQRSASYTLPTSGVANDSVICFQGRISPFRGQSSPTSTITSSGWRESGVRCVRVYNDRPSFVNTGTSSTCDRINYQIDDSDGDRHDATLQISNGSGGWTDISSRSNRPNESNYFNISSYRGFNTRTFRLVISDRGPLGETVTRNFNIGPCATASCGSVTTNPSSPEPGDTFSVTLGISVSGGIGSNGTPASYSATLSGISGVSGTPQTVGPTTINAGTSSSSVVFSDLSSATPIYTTSMTITVSGLRPASFSCSDTLTITNQPYLSIYGNDVLAGGGFDAGCVSTNGEIKARLRGDNAGAGAQLAVFALGTVNGFASAKLRDSGTPSRPNGLTFANTSDPPGYFGGTNCITNHPMKTSGQDITESNLSSWSGEYYKSGDINISGGNINKSTHVAVYVEGNLTVTGDIQYTSPEPWNSMSDIPSIKFVVSGNIYIDEGVTQLDGTYVSRGTIYTCTDGSTTYTIDQLYNNCGGATNDKQLIVYGSFIASNIKWLRTFSTLKDADPSEHPNSPGNTNCDNKPICAAEVIISGPEMYINNRTKFIGGGNNTNVYDSITNMPPVL